ncbi:hypothetical protein Peur_048630 [Populus x canadensis]
MQYSYFGSTLTIGAMIGAITCGPIADYFGRKVAMRFSSTFCVAGWLAIYLAKRNINSFDSVSGAFIIGTVLRWRILALTAKKGREKEFETALQKLHILKAMRFLCILGFCIRIGPCLHDNRGFILSVGYSQTPHIYIPLKSQS